MSGLEPGEMQGDEYALAVLGSYVRVTNIGPPSSATSTSACSAKPARPGSWTRTTALEGQRIGFSAFLGAETLLGPVYLGYGWTDGGDDSLYFYLGRVF